MYGGEVPDRLDAAEYHRVADILGELRGGRDDADMDREAAAELGKPRHVENLFVVDRRPDNCGVAVKAGDDRKAVTVEVFV